ncbi:MAG: hypothetical protein Q8K70_02655 [Bacteroidota bacterium]|nr:hypothetical protein [Bacteroidota bacterium]
MKNKKLLIAMAFIATTIIYLSSCKKNENPIKGSKFWGTQDAGMPTSLNFVEEQLRWIARGYPEIKEFHSPTLFNFLNTHLSGKTYYEDNHFNLKAQCQSQTSIDIEDDVYHSVNRVPFHNGEYDREYFYEFVYENCDWVVGLRIVDTPDLSKPVVFSYETFSGSDSAWGYFWNSGLDSVLLSSENFEDYYVFLVYAQNNCQNTSHSIIEIRGCEINGICEYWYGETDYNCADCPEVKTNQNQKALKIVWVKINEDKTMFDEAWGQNRYELGWSWCLADNQTGIVNFFRRGDPYVSEFNKWNRNQIPIKRKSSGTAKGTITQKSFQNNGIKTMYDLFDINNHDIYMRFFEIDKSGNNGKYDTIKNSNNQVISFPVGSNTIRSMSNEWFIRVKGGTFHQGGTINPGGILHVPAGTTWPNTEVINGKSHRTIEVTSPGLGEITVKLAYEE